MSSSKNSKHETRAQILATRAATSAAGKLASFANPTATCSQPAAMPDDPANAALITADQLSAEFAKQRSSLKEDISLLIRDAVKPLQVSIESLQATVNSFQTRLTSVESVAGDNFDRITAIESTVESLRGTNQSLIDRLEDLENRSRRSNLRILNIPEGSEKGKDPLKFMAELLMQVVGSDIFPSPPELERAHRSPSLRSSLNNSPRPFLVCFSRFQQKEALLRWARNHEPSYQGSALRIYQDFSATLTKKRAAFNGVKQALYQKNIRFHLLYPARLRVFLGDNIHVFNSADEAQKFFDQGSDGPDVMVLGATRLEEGSDIVFHCWADSYPLVSINWTVNDKTVEDPQLILIPNCDSSNSGNYTCTAFNNITGITGSAQHFLTVTGKHSGGLSPGAAAGITAGVIVGLEALIVLLFFLIMHFKKSSEPICTIPKPKKGKQKRKVSRSSTGLEFKNPNTTRATPKARTESRPATPLPAITRDNKPKESIYENIRENEVYCTTLPGR